jgi:glycosyltransferase involved in cell wall biosynthesis
MKIAYIALKGMPLGGGIERYTEELGSRLAQKGNEVVVYATRHYGARDGFYRGMRVKTVPAPASRSLEKLAASLSASLRQCAERNIDVLHFHAFGPSMFSFIPRALGRKVVVQGHGIEWRRSKWGAGGRLFLKLTEIPSVRVPNVVTVVSKVQQDYLKRRYGIESVHIPTGVNPPVLERPSLIGDLGLSGGDYILFAARLVREKGAHYLIEAFKRLGTDLKLVIAGDALHEDAYKAELLGLSGGRADIIFPGFVTGRLRDELFSNCYLFVLPSELEGFSTALLEAMSYGNCCLISDIPENLEALGGFGYCFENRNVDDLADKLRYLLGSPEAVESVKSLARAHVLENYSWDRVAGQFESLYRSLIEN